MSSNNARMRYKRFIKDMSKAILGALIVFGFLAFFVAVTNGAERARTSVDAYGACCRVFNNGTAGSGTCFYVDRNGDCYILTNYHVAGSADCELEFFDRGEPMRVHAVNVWRAYDESRSIDCAVLKVSASAASCITKFVPCWTKGGDLCGEEVVMTTTGAPRAKWLRMIKGKIKSGGGDNNLVFKPTPYGGQSGSSILIEKNGLPYIGGLLTWRSAEEGSETFGGLAQPIARVLKAMGGQTADLPPCPLPANAEPCPSDGNESGGEKGSEPVWVGGEYLIECAEKTYAPPVSVEVWCIQGCAPCALAKSDGIPAWEKLGGVRVRDASGADRFNATALGIRSFPTIRVIDKGGAVVLSKIGYDSAVKAEVLATLKKYNTIKKETPKKEVKESPDTACGRFGLFSDLFNDEGDGDDEAETDPPATDPPAGGDKNNGLFGGPSIGDRITDQLREAIDDFAADLIKDYSGKIRAAIFWLCFLACTLALICYKTVLTILSAVWSCFKWAGGKVAEAVRGLGRKGLEAIAAAVNEKKTEKKESK